MNRPTNGAAPSEHLSYFVKKDLLSMAEAYRLPVRDHVLVTIRIESLLRIE